MLVHQSNHLFAYIRETVHVNDIKKILAVTANDFWHYHYTFSETSAYQPKVLGNQMINNLIINTIVPILFAYGHLHNEEQYKNRALHWLELITAEKIPLPRVLWKSASLIKTLTIHRPSSN